MEKNPTAAQDHQGQINPNSKLLSGIYKSIKDDLEKFHSKMNELGSSHGKSISAMIRTMLVEASNENPMPYRIDPDKLKKAIDREKGVMYDEATKNTLNGLLNSISEKLGRASAVAARKFEENTISFCMTIISMHKEMKVEEFQNSKGEMYSSYMQYMNDVAFEHQESVLN